MTVKELKEMLQQYPDDMEILNTRCSDYDLVTMDDWSIVEAVDKGFYVMRAHPTMSEENKKAVKKYLHLTGN